MEDLTLLQEMAMAHSVNQQLRPALILLVLITLLTGFIYPAVITCIAKLAFPWQANGSLITKQQQVIGSVLIGQTFDQAKYFSSRPSATIPFPYNAMASGGSNLGPSNLLLLSAIKSRITELTRANPHANALIPIDLVTASGSGLDPDISPWAAYYQVARIAKARDLSSNTVTQLVRKMVQSRQFGILGEPRVNVLQLNLTLDAINK